MTLAPATAEAGGPLATRAAIVSLLTRLSSGEPVDVREHTDPARGLVVVTCGGDADWAVLRCGASGPSRWARDPRDGSALPTGEWRCDEELSRCSVHEGDRARASVDLEVDARGERRIETIRFHRFSSCDAVIVAQAEHARWLCEAERALLDVERAPPALTSVDELIEIDVTHARDRFRATTAVTCGHDARARARARLPEISDYVRRAISDEGEVALECSPAALGCWLPSIDVPGLALHFRRVGSGPVLHTIVRQPGTQSEREDRALAEEIHRARGSARGCGTE